MNRAVEVLSALASSARLGALRALVRAGPAGLRSGAVAELMAAPANTASSHLAILTRAGLVTCRREGRTVIYAADFDGVQALLAFMLEDCCDGRPEVCEPVMAVVQRACCVAPEARA